MTIASRSPPRSRSSTRMLQNSRSRRRRLLLERLEERSLLAGFNFADFSDSSALSLLGDAAITADNRLRLTPAIGGQEGAAWYTAEKQFVGAEFSTTFQFQMADNFDSPGGSDGFTFIIQNFAPTYLSGGGGTLGYYGLPNSLVVEFDTFSNFEVNDPSGSHISVHTNGTGPNDWSESLSLGSYNTDPIMDDANVHTAKINYSAGTLSIYLDDLTTPKLTVSVDLADTLSLDAGTAWLGFTGTTGGGYQTHDILDWSFDATVPPTIVSIDNASQIEGDSGASDLMFTVTRSGDLSAAATIDWTTVDGSATASGDYVADAGQLAFAPSEAAQTITIAVNGDTEIETHETFRVQLSGATSGWILDGSGVGTILNDETNIALAPPAGIVSWWTGDNTASDLVGSNHGVLNSGATYAGGKVLSGFDFDGIDDNLQAPTVGLPTGSADRTIELWARIDQQVAGEAFFASYGAPGTSNQAYALGTLSDGRLFVSTWGTAVFGPALQNNRWYHVAATNVGSQFRLYLDGVEVAAGSMAVDTPAGSTFWMGRQTTGSLGDFRRLDGSVDEVSVYDRALNPTEIELIYHAGTGGKIKASSYITADVVSIVEGAGGASTTATFTIQRVGSLEGQAEVNWSTTDGTATAGADYVAALGQVTFLDGESQKFVEVTINDDSESESNETFSLVLATTAAGYEVGGGHAIIVDDDVEVSIGDATAVEGDGSFRFVDDFVYAGSGGIASPLGITVGPDGNLYITHGGLGMVKRYDGQTGQFLGIFADGSSVANQASQVVFHGGYLFVTTGTTGVLRFDATTGASAPADGKPGAQFVTPIDQGIAQGVHGVAFGPDGHLYLTSNVSSQVLKYDGATGGFLGEYVAAGSGGLNAANALVFGADGHLYVASSGNNSVLRYRGPLETDPGEFIDAFVPSGTGGLTWIPTGGLQFGPDGDLYVVSRDTNSVLRFDGFDGTLVETVVEASEGGIASPRGLTFGASGRLLVTSAGTHEILRYGPAAEAAFVVTLSHASTDAVSVNYVTATGTADGTDFVPVSTPSELTFAPGQTSRTILVQTLDDAVYEGNETFVVNLSNASGGLIVDSQGLGTIVDNEPPPTKFYVVDDGALDQNFEYGADGTAVENYAIASGNTAPRGAASTAAGDRVWVGDVNRNVYVYDPVGGLVGSWTAGSLPTKGPQVQGIAVDGTDVWIVDAKSDKVYLYSGAASRTSGSQNAASSFALNSGNKSPVGIVTDGTSLWVANNANQDKVFKYTLSGTLLGSWTMSGGGGSPTGITLDPASPSALWIVDNSSDRVYQYDGAVSRTSGSVAADAFFDLAAGNTNPQGIADPPVAVDARLGISEETGAASDGMLLDPLDGRGWRAAATPQGNRSSSLTGGSRHDGALRVDAALALLDWSQIAAPPSANGLLPRASEQAGENEWQTGVDALLADDDGLVLNPPGWRGRGRG